MTKQARGVILLCLVSITALAALYSLKPVRGLADVQIISQRGFYTPPPTGAYGLYNVVGEVLNNGTVPVNHINVTAAFYNSQNVVIGTATGQAYMDCLLPGQKSPFRFALSDSNAPNVVSYSLSSPVFNQFPQGKPLALQILNSTYYASVKDGYVRNTGVVKNNGTLPALNTQVVVTYYYKTNGTIFFASKTTAHSSNLTQGATTNFEISSAPLVFTPQNVYMNLTAESKEYLSPVYTNSFQDTITPHIDTPIYYPTAPASNQVVSVNVTVTKPDYASKVAQVWLHYKAGATQISQNMSAYGTLYRWYINAFSAGQVVQFWFVATDNAGNTATSQLYTYTVQGQPPVGVPVEVLIVAFIVIILLAVIIKYRKRIF
jgi:hypothetical protein